MTTTHPVRWLVRMFPHQCVVTGDTFDDAEQDLHRWCRAVGVERTEVQEFRPLSEPEDAVRRAA